MRRCACMSLLALAVAGCSSTGGESPLASEVAWSEFENLAVVHAAPLADGGRVEYASSGDWFSRVNRDVEHRGTMVCFDARGERRWRSDEPPPQTLPADFDLASAFFTSRFSIPVELTWGTATLAVDAAQVYVVQWNDLSDGADVIAFDLATGERRWARPVQGLGEVWHSRYWNDVRARIVRGALVVFGHEAAGDYVEAWSPRGERLWTRHVE